MMCTLRALSAQLLGQRLPTRVIEFINICMTPRLYFGGNLKASAKARLLRLQEFKKWLPKRGSPDWLSSRLNIDAVGVCGWLGGWVHEWS